MSVLKLLLLNKDKKEDIIKFRFKFGELNPDLEFLSENISNYFCSDEINEKYVIPQEYSFKKDENGVFIINKGNNQLFKLYYYPYVGKNEYFSGVAMSLKPLTKYNFSTEKEYYLEKASIGTYKKYGVDRLNAAVEAAEKGNYNVFDENSIEYAKQIKTNEFSKIMMDTLNKEKNYEQISFLMY